ncbi:MAG: hypothetical protein JSR77_15550 [Planctomycetes bacterium]|nr:hypothetical protein [Planctomycetota bacterium]
MRQIVALLAVQGLAAVAAAQTLGTGDWPRCFMWETPPAVGTPWDDDEFDERFMPMVRLDIYYDQENFVI